MKPRSFPHRSSAGVRAGQVLSLSTAAPRSARPLAGMAIRSAFSRSRASVGPWLAGAAGSSPSRE
ncbi:hypothetical protein [Kibdelosporangium phytohabitans]|uniref:hypothetical protein n=1 Tax=Kibdelosporangium phytohabitans TaxID=860235 RepID=UPI0012FA7961|nr:hypothetical protein [Kibdelosporangium phytohabitans]MBE1461250.1 hypothetical protein [Kibdelosporangium phytohabitans]